MIEKIRAKCLKQHPSAHALIHLKCKDHRVFFRFLLLLSGDIHLHPGPTYSPCSLCNRSVRKGLPCNQCGLWVHKRCDKISDIDYDSYCRVPRNQMNYVCLSCQSKASEFHSDQLPFADSSFTEPSSEELNTSDVNFEEHLTDTDIWANFNKRGLHFLHLNVNGLLSKIEELRLTAQKTNAAVIGILEAKLDESVLDGEVNIDGYEIKRCDRNRQGGGVACYIRKDLAFNPREDFSPDIENVFLDILLPKSKPILVGILYRPPTASGFLDKLTLAISRAVDFDSQEVYILGDLNINLNHKSSDTSNGIRRYKEFCSHHGLKQIIQSPTRVTDKSSSLLDHILTNSYRRISQHGVFDLGLSDHQLIYCTRKATRIKIHKHTFIKIRTFKNYTKQLFLDKLGKIKFPNYMEYGNINAAYSHFVEVITGIIDELAPAKEIRVKKDSQEWMDQEVFEGIRTRNKLLTKYRTSQIYSDYINFKKARNRVQSLIKRKKKSFITDKLNENIGKPKELWKCLKSLGLSSGKDSSSKICLNNKGSPCFDDKTNAETFKTFFSNLASNLVKKLQRTPHKLDEVRKYYQHLNLTEPFSLAPTSLENVLKLLEEINPSKATGLDNIAGKFLKDGATVLARPITELCNLSILLSTFPDGCKQAKLKPLFKKGSKGDPKNYRPISLLPQPSKIVEKIIHGQVQKYLDDNNILYRYQSGFRAHHSTDTCLSYLNNKILQGFETGMFTDMILIDLQKAFDTIDHEIFLDKIACLGFSDSAILWFKSYLQDRSFSVNIGKEYSDPRNLSCGVPQGSILGPLIFLLYVNDMARAVDCDLLLYADDSCLIFRDTDVERIENNLNRNFNSLCNWFVENKLSIHFGEDKTKSILFARKKYKDLKKMNIRRGDIEIKRHSVVTYLGSVLDENLSGESMATKMLGKINGKLKFLYRKKKFSGFLSS